MRIGRRPWAHAVLGHCLAVTGRYEQVEPMLFEANTRIAEALGPHAREATETMRWVAELHDTQGAAATADD